MTSRDYLGYLTLSQFMASAMNPIQDALGRLSHDALHADEHHTIIIYTLQKK